MSNQRIVEKLNVTSLTPPAKYCVILHNDDYTTMDFVIDVLMRFFGHDEKSATQIMLAVHKEGKGICGIYSAEVAETKVFQVTHYAQQNRFPLKCTMEKIPS